MCGESGGAWLQWRASQARSTLERVGSARPESGHGAAPGRSLFERNQEVRKPASPSLLISVKVLLDKKVQAQIHI